MLLTTLFSLSSPKLNCLRIVWFMGGDVTQGGRVIFFFPGTYKGLGLTLNAG